MRWKMTEIPVEDVPTEVRLRAEGAAIIAARMLEMPRPTVKYFATMPCPEGEAMKADDLLAELGRAVGALDAREPLETWFDEVPQLGLTRRREPGVVRVMAFAEPFDLVKTTLHECRHYAQYAYFDLWKSVPPSGWEWDSDQWSEENYMQVAARLEASFQRGMAKLAAKRWGWIRGNHGRQGY